MFPNYTANVPCYSFWWNYEQVQTHQSIITVNVQSCFASLSFFVFALVLLCWFLFYLCFGDVNGIRIPANETLSSGFSIWVSWHFIYDHCPVALWSGLWGSELWCFPIYQKQNNYSLVQLYTICHLVWLIDWIGTLMLKLEITLVIDLLKILYTRKVIF